MLFKILQIALKHVFDIQSTVQSIFGHNENQLIKQLLANPLKKGKHFVQNTQLPGSYSRPDSEQEFTPPVNFSPDSWKRADTMDE